MVGLSMVCMFIEAIIPRPMPMHKAGCIYLISTSHCSCHRPRGRGVQIISRMPLGWSLLVAETPICCELGVVDSKYQQAEAMLR